MKNLSEEGTLNVNRNVAIVQTASIGEHFRYLYFWHWARHWPQSRRQKSGNKFNFVTLLKLFFWAII